MELGDIGVQDHDGHVARRYRSPGYRCGARRYMYQDDGHV